MMTQFKTRTVWDFYVGEEIEYLCGVCGWSEAKVVEININPEKIVLIHNDQKIGLYSDELDRIDEREYNGN